MSITPEHAALASITDKQSTLLASKHQGYCSSGLGMMAYGTGMDKDMSHACRSSRRWHQGMGMSEGLGVGTIGTGTLVVLEAMSETCCMHAGPPAGQTAMDGHE